ncbi:hypothetical protein [Methylobacterium sp. J-068]|uniref:hypothetical protein n=1 Tax=Methylobacterium sp. J-068 TaxID=2836649 RepID=UPI001FB87310|nr:hypothetical protein [Methylobacterium sp. J-068]MCJ2036771.1 hypothetical protein [Methylobacterium sp. J-068]
MPVHPRPRFRTLFPALAALLPLVLAPAEALAGRSPTERPSEARGPGTTWTSSEPENAACQRSRRKLWQPGEGWVVRSVTVCR